MVADAIAGAIPVLDASKSRHEAEQKAAVLGEITNKR
jgi:hypothetical protein